VTPMGDARIEAFLADVLALEGENPDAIREGVNPEGPVMSVDYEALRAENVRRYGTDIGRIGGIREILVS
jgi:hypothetical protein